MSHPGNIHHINFLFADLDAAVARFETLFGKDSFIYEDLAARGVRTARVNVGGTWLVLVSPTAPDADTVPANHLREHGEGFFLLSFGVDDLDRAIETLESASGSPQATDVREGLAQWRIADLPGHTVPGVPLQLTEIPREPPDGS